MFRDLYYYSIVYKKYLMKWKGENETVSMKILCICSAAVQ